MATPTHAPTPDLGDQPPADLADCLGAHRALFEGVMGPGPAPATCFSPGRVNMFGGHLDYNGGPVCPTAINRGTFISLRPRTDGVVRLASTFEGDSFTGSVAGLPDRRLGHWYDYPLGVLRALVDSDERCATALKGGVDIHFGGNLPVGAGLSSSASICVGTAFALDTVFGLGLTPAEHVAAALDAERGFVGVQCGIMDPYAVGFARARRVLWLDCKDESFEHLPLDFTRLSIGVADTGVQRSLARGEFNRRVAECKAAFEILGPKVPGATVLRDVPRETLDAHEHLLEDAVARRARHVIDEVERTFRARQAFRDGDLGVLGEVMSGTHRSFQTLYECSSEELDVLVAAAESSPGVFGARLTGAGFGGCIVMLVAAGSEEAVTERVQAEFRSRYDRTPPVAFFQGDEGPRAVHAAG